MASTSSHEEDDGAKKNGKTPRPLIAPALPFKFMPRPIPAQEPALPIPRADPANELESSTAAQSTDTIAPATQRAEQGPPTNHHTDLQPHTNNEPILSTQQTQHTRHQSSTAPEVLDEDIADNDAEVGSRSLTPRASSRAALSSMNSSIPDVAQKENHPSGRNSGALLSKQLQSVDVARSQSELEAQARTQYGQTAQTGSTTMHRQHVTNEEPILDWADEMSEEMPPDTLHIPCVPHLPELSSEANALQDKHPRAAAHLPGAAASPKPVFGSTAILEPQSNGVAKDTPGRQGLHLTNGYSYASESNLEHAGTSQTSSKPEGQTNPIVHGNHREISQLLTEQPLPDLVDHLARLFETKEWADWTIQIVSLNASYPSVAYHAHGVVISRSQLLRSQMRNRLQTRAMTPVITLSPPRYVQPAAFEAALKYLYNEAPLTTTECAQYFSSEGTTTSSTIKSYRLDFCFSYWLSGCLLGLSVVTDAGLELLYENLDWDTAELLVKAALDMKRTSPIQSLSIFSNGATISPSTPAATASPVPAKEGETEKEQMSLNQDVHSVEVIGVLIDALANGRLHIDLKSFRLDSSPPEMLRSRLPDVQKMDRSHSALSSITFGSLTATSLTRSKPHSRSSQPVFSSGNSVDAEHDFTAAEKALSAILLNIPFQEFNEFFEGFLRSFAVDDVLDLFDKVLLERETRRLHVARSDWYQSEVVHKRQLPEVDSEEKLIPDGEQSRLLWGSALNTD